MEDIFSYICEHVHEAPWLLFCLLLLTGLGLPISEDIIVIGAGAIASTCLSEYMWRLYIWTFLGCYISAWESYWIGRLLGPRLYKIPLFRSTVTVSRLALLRHYYAKFGVFTFIIGRFCPGGIRNSLFLSSGFIRMPFLHYLLRDGIACLISTSVFFYLGYYFGQNKDLLLLYIKRYKIGLLVFFIVLGAAGLSYWLYRHYRRRKNEGKKG